MTSISPWIIKDFFNDTDLKIFKDYRDVLLKEKKRVLLKDITRAQIEKSMNDWIVDPFLGRIQCSLEWGEMPQDMIDIAMKVAKEINPNCEFRYVSYVRYSNQFGKPQLGPHLDPPTKEDFMFDIQLDSNVDWPIEVAEIDGIKQYTLKNNDCLVVDITRQTHWRTPQFLKNGEFLDMLFFSFVDNSLEQPTLEWQTDVGLKYMDDYNLRLEKIYPREEYDQSMGAQSVEDNINNQGQVR
jgi:hypothetical protein